MAECECFELTLLIGEQVCGPETEKSTKAYVPSGAWAGDLHLCRLKTPLNPDGREPTLPQSGAWQRQTQSLAVTDKRKEVEK